MEIDPTHAQTALDHEMAQARIIEAGIYADHILSGGLVSDTGATPSELATISLRGKQAWREVVQAGLRLVGYLAAQHRRRSGRPWEELFQEGCLGFMEALRRYDYRRRLRISTAVVPWITAAMGRVDRHVTLTSAQAKHRDRSQRAYRAAVEMSQVSGRDATIQEIAAEMEESIPRVALLLARQGHAVSLQSLIGGGWDLPDSRFDPGILALTVSDREIRRLVETLPPLERRVIELRYGFGSGVPVAWRDTALVLGVGVARARRLESEALAHLRASSLVA